MTQFKFKYTYKDDHSGREHKTIVITNSSNLTDILNNVEEFLRGCGFHFTGHLDLVEPVVEFREGDEL